MTDISNNDDTISTDDLDERIAELESERDALKEAIDEAQTAYNEHAALAEPTDRVLSELADETEDAERALEEFDRDYGPELKALTDLRSECSSGDFLIRESYFKDYAREHAEDVHGQAMRVSGWPFHCIDWEQAADELRHDYSAVEFDGVTYYYR